jgi:hypothetical protein
MGFKWVVPPSEVFPQAYKKYTQQLFVTGRRVADARAAEATEWMKSNAPWQDRTGAARAGLHVDVNQAPAVLAELTFAHGADVPYGIWLEIANGGRYAIIAPAVDYWGPRLMKDVQGIVNLKLATFG